MPGIQQVRESRDCVFKEKSIGESMNLEKLSKDSIVFHSKTSDDEVDPVVDEKKYSSTEEEFEDAQIEILSDQNTPQPVENKRKRGRPKKG